MSPQAHGNALPEGYRLHWYRIGPVLGQGGFGITYLATDTNLDKQVAIKEYLPIEFAVREGDSQVRPFTEDRKETYLWGLERFLNEARTLAKFIHPNIVRVFAVFEANNTAYMVMEYEQGSSFDELIRFGRIEDEASLLRIVHPLLDGLEHTHEAGFVHRDIKPGNIYVRSDGSPVLLDFGSARMALGVQTRTLTSVVSPGFAPYEQYHSEEGKQGPWTDVYGFGATLYAALNRGKGPLDAIVRGNARIENNPDPLEPASAIGRGRYSAKFVNAIDAALKFTPQERPQSIAAWREMFPALGEAPEIQEAATEILPVATTRPFPETTSQSRSLRIVATAVVVLALLIGGWWYVTQQRDRAGAQSASARPSDVIGDSLKNGSRGPEMMRIPTGQFVMGSPPEETGRNDAEGPQHQVTIPSDFALGKFKVTVGEFRRFVDATGFQTHAEKIGGCFTGQGKRDGATWHDPGFKRPLGDDHPVVCVAWKDAIEYAKWLSAQTGASYRLPSEAEWEYAARAGTTTARFWGDDPAAACRYANVGDVARTNKGGNVSGTPHECLDRFGGLAPVGRFQANAFGLHDVLGNVWEWTADCWRESYAGVPSDGSSVNDERCRHHTRRGGNFSSGTEEIRSAARKKGRSPGLAIGFRLAREL